MLHRKNGANKLNQNNALGMIHGEKVCRESKSLLIYGQLSIFAALVTFFCCRSKVPRYNSEFSCYDSNDFKLSIYWQTFFSVYKSLKCIKCKICSPTRKKQRKYSSSLSISLINFQVGFRIDDNDGQYYRDARIKYQRTRENSQ